MEKGIEKTHMRLFQLSEGGAASIFRKTYWMGKIIDWTTRKQALKVEISRFIEVFPCQFAVRLLQYSKRHSPFCPQN